MTRHHWNAILGVISAGFALFALLWWIPASVESGVIVEVRRQTVVGDAMAPTVWAVGMGLLGLLLAVQGLLKLREGVHEAPTGGPTLANLRYLGILLGTVFGSLVVMTWAGPLAVKLAHTLGSDVDSYRALRATRPWKYIGYCGGGFCMVYGLMTYITHRFSWRQALVAALVVIAMALAYDLPFKNLLLPPNGDL